MCINPKCDDKAFRGFPIAGLLHNEDCTNVFYNSVFLPGNAGEIIDQYVDVIAQAGVTVLFCNTNARRTNYHSAVWSSFWDGYDPDGADDQPFFASLNPAQTSHWRRLVHNMWEVHRQGVDYPARVLSRCRHHGISPWISLRMNDVHFAAENQAHPFHTDFERNERLHRQGCTGYFAKGLDYAHEEVRAHYWALIEETVSRFDVDGIELDFLREAYLFSAGGEPEGAKLLTRWLTDVRRLVDQAAQQRGRPIWIGVRVPSHLETALALGLDVPTWAGNGLVNLVVPAPRWATLEFDIPLPAWREALGARVVLAGGLEALYHPHGGAPHVIVTPEHSVAAAVAVLSGGGDAVYLFNYFQHNFWPPDMYRQTLRAMSSLDSLLRLPRRHGVTYRDVQTPGKVYVPPLPAKGCALTFALPLGPTPSCGSKAEVWVELAAPHEGQAWPRVAVNGVSAGTPVLGGDAQRAGWTYDAASAALKLKDAPAHRGAQVLIYDLPLTALPGRNADTITITTANDQPIHVLCLEVRIVPQQKNINMAC